MKAVPTEALKRELDSARKTLKLRQESLEDSMSQLEYAREHGLKSMESNVLIRIKRQKEGFKLMLGVVSDLEKACGALDFDKKSDRAIGNDAVSQRQHSSKV